MSTPKKSQANLSKRNTSGYLGVSKTKNGKWGAQITLSVTDKKGKVKKVVKWLGRFDGTNEGKILAAKAYDAAAVEAFGKDAKLNFPTKKASPPALAES